LQRDRVLRRDWREIKVQRARDVRGHGHVAARGAHDQHLASAERTTGVKEFERLAQAAERLAASESRLPAERVEHAVGSGKRAGVAMRRARRGGGAAGLDHGDRLAGSARLVGRIREPLRVFDTLEV
jgi:hypothetical protein